MSQPKVKELYGISATAVEGGAGFTEQKTTTVYLHEPLHFKAIPFKDGYRIEFSIKMHWDQVDSMSDPDMPIMKGVANMIKIIEGQLNSKVLDVKRKDDANL